MKTTRSLPYILISYFSLVGCLLVHNGCWTPLGTGKQMQTDILALKNELAAAKKQLEQQETRLNTQLQSAEKAVLEVNKTTDELDRSARMSNADFGLKMERLINEVQQLRGSVEQTEYRLGQIETKMQDLSQIPNDEHSKNPPPKNPNSHSAKPTTNKETTTTTATAEETEAKKNRPDTASSPAPTPPPPKDKKGLLQYALQLSKQNKISEARGVYQNILKKWPKEEGVSDEAYFQLGSLAYQEKNLAGALQEYIKVVEKFPKSKIIDGAYFKIGLLSKEMGNLRDAQIFFNEIVLNHPNSTYFKAAENNLTEINKQLNQPKKSKTPPPPKSNPKPAPTKKSKKNSF